MIQIPAKKDFTYDPGKEAPSCAKEMWQDEQGGVWFRSVDGDLVVVPSKYVQRAAEYLTKAAKNVL